MGEDKIDLNKFMGEMVSLIAERLKKQDALIEELKKEINGLKKNNSLAIDESVLKVLKGKYDGQGI